MIKRASTRRQPVLILLVLGAATLMACAGESTAPAAKPAAPGKQPTAPVILVGNPAVGPDQGPTSSPARTSAAPAARGPVDCAKFESASATPDPTNLAPGQRFRAEWRYLNCGSSDWNGYRAVRIEGQLGPPTIQLGAWLPGATGEIWFEDTAPPNPGRYRVAYRLVGGGAPFADFWGEVVVVPRR
jgi:hypothetical protein